MKQLLLVILSIFLFYSCSTTRITQSMQSGYRIINKLETINCKGRFIYYLVPTKIGKIAKDSSFGSIDYVIIDCDSFEIGDELFTADNINFYLH